MVGGFASRTRSWCRCCLGRATPSPNWRRQSSCRGSMAATLDCSSLYTSWSNALWREWQADEETFTPSSLASSVHSSSGVKKIRLISNSAFISFRGFSTGWSKSPEKRKYSPSKASSATYRSLSGALSCTYLSAKWLDNRRHYSRRSRPPWISCTIRATHGIEAGEILCRWRFQMMRCCRL